VVSAPFVTDAFPEVSGFGVALTGAAAVRFSSAEWLQFKLPVGLVRLDFPAGAQVAETALGNIELTVEHRLETHPATRFGFSAALLVPTAEHGPETSLLDNRALALIGALNGGTDSSLWTPGVLGFRLGTRAEHAQGPFAFRADLEVPLLVRVSDASLPEGAETHPIGILPFVALRATWWVTPGLGASLGGSVIAELLRVQEPALEHDQEQRAQAAIEPGIVVRPSDRVLLQLDATVPVGGSLGGEAWSIGLRGQLDL
jgi:hypothetical protein